MNFYSHTTTTQNFITSQNNQYSFQDTFRYAHAISNFLLEKHIPTQSLIGILLPHNENFCFSVLGTWLIRMVPIPIDNSISTNELEGVIKLLELKYIITNEFFLTKYKSIEVSFLLPPFSKSDEKKIVQRYNVDDEALIILTSGSINKPKAVVHTFRSLEYSARISNDFINPNSHDIWLASLPFFHIGGFAIFLRCLLNKTPMVIPQSFQTEEVISLIENKKITLASFVKTSLYRIIERRIKFSHKIKYFFAGGGSVDNQTIQQAIELGYNAVKVYGSSETASMITALAPSDFAIHPNSSGKVLDKNIQISLSDEGEILIQSPSLFKRYIYNPLELKKKETKAWYYSDDIGHLKDEYLYLEGRKSTIIISGGKKINPAEVEMALMNHSSILMTCCFGIPDEIWGEMVCVSVCLKEEHLLSINEIKEYLKSLLSSYKIPKQIVIIDTMPLLPSGKIDITSLKF